MGRGVPTQILFTVPDITLSPTADLTISAPLQDGAEGGAGSGIDFTGGGTVLLTGDSFYTGPTTIPAGITILAGSGGTTGSLGTGPILNDGTLVINRSTDLVRDHAISGSGTFEKVGTGNLTLNGDSTYITATTVSGGRLILNGSLAGDVNVADGAGIGGGGFIGGNLRVGTSAGGSFLIDPFSPTGIQAVDLDLKGVSAISFAGLANFGVNTYSIATYSGTLTDGNGGTLADSFKGTGARLVTVRDNAGTLEADISVENVVWTGATSGVWQVGGAAANWLSSDSRYYDQDEVLFDDSAGNRNVILQSNVAPYLLSIENSVGNDYTFTGAFGVNGPVTLIKDGDGTVTVATNNTYSLGTTVQNGTLRIGNGGTSGNLGTGAILNDGTIVIDRSDNLNLANAVSGIGSLVKEGPNTVTFTGGNSKTYTGETIVAEGTLNLASNDIFRNHSESVANLTIEEGALVTNGTGAIGYNTFVNLTLNGGELRATGDLSAVGTGRFQAYGIKGTVTVGGTAPSLISDVSQANGAINIGGIVDLVGGVGASAVFDVEDVTEDNQADLLVSAKLQNHATVGTYAEVINGLTKTGTGTLSLTRANTYTGNTAVEAGTLALAEPYLADAADVIVTTGANLALNFEGTDTIDQLFIGGNAKMPGIYGAVGSQAQFEIAQITGTGRLMVTTGADGYAAWAAGFAGLTDTSPALDFENDGLATGLEFLLGGDPTITDAGAITPTAAIEGSDLVFRFRRSALANNDPNAAFFVEYSSTLGAWTPAVNLTDGVEIGEENDIEPGIDLVTVRIPVSLAEDGKLFARLNFQIVTP